MNELRGRQAATAAGANDHVLEPEKFEALIETFKDLGQRWLASARRCAVGVRASS